jgi:hypothetical protein
LIKNSLNLNGPQRQKTAHTMPGQTSGISIIEEEDSQAESHKQSSDDSVSLDNTTRNRALSHKTNEEFPAPSERKVSEDKPQQIPIEQAPKAPIAHAEVETQHKKPIN